VCPNSNRREFLFKAVQLALAGCIPAGSMRPQDAAPKEEKAPNADKTKNAKSDPAPIVYTPGGDVKPPKVIHYVEPEFSSSSKEAFVEGVVKISTVVTPDGLPTDLHVSSGLNAQDDQKAIDAVKQWRFQAGTKSGKPVHVKVSIEIDFHLL
jgi:TonB family protein